MANPIDLVTKAQVESWLNSNNPAFNTTTDTVNIPLAITDVSQEFLGFTGRHSLNRFVALNDFMDASGGDRQFLPEFPVGLVTGVWAFGVPIAPGSIGQNGTITPGWVLDRNRESISIVGISPGGYGVSRGAGGSFAATGGPLTRTYGGYGFGRANDQGRQNIQVAYFAGGAVMFREVVTVPAGPGPYTATVNQSSLFWADLGQVYYNTPQNGQLVQLTLASGPPAQGQYTVAAGVYTFNSADAGQKISIDYGYDAAMPDLQMAAILQVCETLYTRKSIGLRSQGSPESGTTLYTNNTFTSDVLRIVSKYRRAMQMGG